MCLLIPSRPQLERSRDLLRLDFQELGPYNQQLLSLVMCLLTEINPPPRPLPHWKEAETYLGLTSKSLDHITDNSYGL